MGIQIVESNLQLCSEFKQWCENEWREEIVISPSHVPKPIFACYDQQLVGGVAFSLFSQPFTRKQVVWINALLVKPDYREKGIGSLLIQHAVNSCHHLYQDELYVYTHRPNLYTQLGWVEVSGANAEPDHFVLKQALLKAKDPQPVYQG